MKILLYIFLLIKNSVTQTAHYNTFHLFRYPYFRYTKSLFTTETIEYVKKQSTFKENYKLHGQITQEFLGFRIKISSIIFLYEHKYIGGFSNLHEYTFKNCKHLVQKRNNNDNENKYKTSLVILGKTNIALF